MSKVIGSMREYITESKEIKNTVGELKKINSRRFASQKIEAEGHSVELVARTEGSIFSKRLNIS